MTVSFSPFEISPIVKHALTGIIISHISHLLAVITLHYLSFTLVPSTKTKGRQIAFTAACLHILSPAGLFLSAPYGESTFAFFNFAGMLCYVFAVRRRFTQYYELTKEALWTLLAGACFGIASMIRSNGLLSGSILAYDAAEAMWEPLGLVKDRAKLIRFGFTIVSGILISIGFATPQVVAYMEHCTGTNFRPWCSRFPPSIYNWVQEQYWEVGFLRYWTISNLPLFLLAAPMLAIMLLTSRFAVHSGEVVDMSNMSSEEKTQVAVDAAAFGHAMPRLAVPQLILAILAATTFHVQIINRISSGYPIWYIVLAAMLCSSTQSKDDDDYPAPGKVRQPRGGPRHASRRSTKDKDRTWWKNPSSIPVFPSRGPHLQWIVRSMVLYAIVQGGLYASFLPPA